MRLAILDDFQNVVLSVADWSVIEDRIEITVFNDHLTDQDALVERLQPFDIIVVIRERTPMPRTLIERLPNLKLLLTGGMRNLSIDEDAVRDRGITLCGTQSLGSPTSELAWGLMLATMRLIPQQVQAVREGGWQVGLGVGLEGKTLGVIGLGRLGSAVAHYGKAFAMDVVAWSGNLTAERCAEVGVRQAPSLEALLSESDVVTIHLVLSDRTRGLIGRDELAAMKPGAYLINTSRGPIVDEAALIEAVTEGGIAGAGLDVFDVEPLPPDHPYRTSKGIVATPHIGYVSKEGYERYFSQVIEDIEAWLRGEPIRVIAA